MKPSKRYHGRKTAGSPRKDMGMERRQRVVVNVEIGEGGQYRSRRGVKGVFAILSLSTSGAACISPRVPRAADERAAGFM